MLLVHVACSPRENCDVLLEQDRSETRVEGTDTLVLQDLGESTNETVGEGWVTDETDTGSLKRAEGDVGEELGEGRRDEVDTSSVVGGILDSDQVDRLLLEEFISTELESALEEITSEGRTGTSQKGTSALLGYDLAETTNQTTVVGNRVELDSGLDALYKY